MSSILNIFEQIGLVFAGFWSEVCVPFWNSLVGWVKGYLPWVGKFADFCFELFRFRYKARVYSYAVLLPIVLLVILITAVRKKRRKKRHERCAKTKAAVNTAGGE